jgi:hypothetical protein
MGGVLIFATVLPITLAANIIDRRSILLPLGTIVAAGLLGLTDDLTTIVGRSPLQRLASASRAPQSAPGRWADRSPPALLPLEIHDVMSLGRPLRDGPSTSPSRRRHRPAPRRSHHRRSGGLAGGTTAWPFSPTASSPCSRTRPIWPPSASPLSAPPPASSGTTAFPPACSWAMPAPWLWAHRWRWRPS